MDKNRIRNVAASALIFVTALGAGGKSPVIDVIGPTVIAFFPPVARREMDTDPDTNEALSDFQLYASRVRQPLTKEGIAFHELYARSFQVRNGSKTVTFKPAKGGVGYYFAAPGRKPRIVYGVMTDIDILHEALEYFAEKSKQ